MKMDELKKVSEMEKLAYEDYRDAVWRLGEDDVRTQRLKYRHIGILEVKRELMRYI